MRSGSITLADVAKQTDELAIACNGRSRIRYFASATHCATRDLATSMQKVSPLFILMMVCSAL